MSGLDRRPTRSALLELIDEQVVVKEAYVFLDEKRLLLASELLRQLKLYQQLNNELKELNRQATETMLAAVSHHGLDGLQVYPPGSLEAYELQQITRNFMGVTLVETELFNEQAAEDPGINAENKKRLFSPNHSTVADLCKQLFSNIVLKNAVLAGLSGNLYRLLTEYRLTERRSRALENVILPEIEQSMRVMTAHLEELDLEDAIRVHLLSRKQR